jgi:hypothetical protein
MNRLALAQALVAVLAATSAAQGGASPEPFPHPAHERLFPLCESCHAGIAPGNAATSMPDEASCRTCHNGTDVAAVAWQRPVRVVGLLRYSHPAHISETDSAGRACATCHATPGATRLMDVGRATPESCQGCHTHRASSHYATDNRCATCHVPLTAATGLTREAVAELPRPAWHEAESFAAIHAPATELAAATCATCHARESCSRCHVNAAQQPLIASLGGDARVAALVAGRPAVYPIPADHRADDFTFVHGTTAREATNRCGACHARPSCTTCHIGSGARDVVARIPVAERGGAQGVQLKLQPPPVRNRPPFPLLVARTDTVPRQPATIVRVHDPGYRTAHGPQAASGILTCSGCHEQKFCSDCHAGENQRRFHAANFTQRHAADSWSRESECAACHNAELFCRSCHQQLGLASKGRLDAAYHDAQPQWLLQHGRAARQGLQSCTTCHVQKDCLACHSTVGWSVSPHGPGYPAGRLANRNATQCLLCHLRVPGR